MPTNYFSQKCFYSNKISEKKLQRFFPKNIGRKFFTRITQENFPENFPRKYSPEFLEMIFLRISREKFPEQERKKS